MGRCPDCGSWNSLTEEAVSKPEGRGARGATGARPIAYDLIKGGEGGRRSTGIRELDRVLGGGLVAGSVILIGGDPGIGKSTLLLQAMALIAAAPGGDPKISGVLYVSGEESPHQIRLRGERLGVRAEGLFVYPETELDRILATAREMGPRAVVIDSIQTIYSETVASAPGSVTQLRESAGTLMRFAKESGTPTFLIGHVTKEGAIAGPRVLEHIVDTVLYFEGDRGQPFRILRAVKNRFGSTNEIGVFEMRSSGLEEVTNPSELFLSDRGSDAAPAGSVVIPSIEGTRPILVELQALVSPCNFGIPRRTAIGADSSRLSLLLAVMEKRVGIHVGAQDVFVNVVGGLQLGEPAVDLGLVAAVASSLKDRPIPKNTAVFGEVGLGGEVRAVAQAELRLNEAAKMGFKRCILPERNLAKLSNGPPLEGVGVGSVREALEALDS